MIFDHHDQSFDSSNSGNSHRAFNRLKHSTGSSLNYSDSLHDVHSDAITDKLDLSELVKFWDAPQTDDLSLVSDNASLFKSSEKWDLLADALNMADSLCKENHFVDAELFPEADQISGSDFEQLSWEEQVATRYELVMSLLSKAVVAREADEIAKSKAYLQQTLREFLEFSHTDDQDDIEVQNLMGQIFLEMSNQFLEAEDLLSAYQFTCHTVKLAHEIKEQSLYANALATLGVIVGLDGHLDLSFQLLSEAADRHRELEDHEGYITDLMNLGELVSRDGMWETSATLLSQAIELSRQYECIHLFLKASELRNQVESIIRVKATDPQRN